MSLADIKPWVAKLPRVFFGQIFKGSEMKNINNRIRIAIQKSGRLSEESFRLLAGCGIYVKPRKEQLFCHSDNFPLALNLML